MLLLKRQKNIIEIYKFYEIFVLMKYSQWESRYNIIFKLFFQSNTFKNFKIIKKKIDK